MERGEIRDRPVNTAMLHPDFAMLNPGYSDLEP
jgi:hypothetical protein